MLIFRETQSRDVESLFAVRERTRENPIPREHLASIGITRESVAASLQAGEIVSWVCEHESRVVAFCSGDPASGEVLVLAVLPEYEGRGIGRELLGRTVAALRATGQRELWLAASPDPASRAHGFYRAQGWRPRGDVDQNGDEILVLKPGT